MYNIPSAEITSTFPYHLNCHSFKEEKKSLPEIRGQSKLLNFCWRTQVHPMTIVCEAERPCNSEERKSSNRILLWCVDFL